MITRMDGDPIERTTPDLFSTGAAKGGSSAPLTKSPAAEATTDTTPPRHILPKDLPNAIKHLSDTELDSLHAATLEEMMRRGRTPQGVETDLHTLRHRFDIRSNLMKTRSTATEKRQHVDIAQAPPFDAREVERRSRRGNRTRQAAQSTTTVAARASRIRTKPHPILAMTPSSSAMSACATSQATSATPSGKAKTRR